MWLARSLGSNKSKQPPSPASCSCLSHSLAKGLACPAPTTWVAFTSCTNFGERSELGGNHLGIQSGHPGFLWWWIHSPLSPPPHLLLFTWTSHFRKLFKSEKKLEAALGGYLEGGCLSSLFICLVSSAAQKSISCVMKNGPSQENVTVVDLLF